MKMQLDHLKFQFILLILTWGALDFSPPALAYSQAADVQLKSKLYTALMKDQADQHLKTPYTMFANHENTSAQIPEEIRNLNLFKQANITNVLTLATQPNFFEVLKTEIILPICSTRTGLKLCTTVFGYEKETPNDEAVLIAPARRNISGFLNRLRIVLSADPVQFSGFTVEFNPWLFLDMNTLSRAQLIRLVVHEMFQIVDIKNQIHLSPAIRADLLGAQIQCQEFDFLLDHRLRLGLSHVRAERVEDMVLRELGFQFQAKNYENLTCDRLISEDF